MKKNILLVEYASASIDAIKEALLPPVFNITAADEGEAAKTLLKDRKFDLVITAAMLPKFHGFSLSLHVAKNYPGTKVVIISGIYKGEETRQKAIHQYKADDFFEKPINKKDFKKKILEILNITEKDILGAFGQATIKIPIVDTAKLPTLKKIGEDGKKLTSEDLFGDLISSAGKESDEAKQVKKTKERPVPETFKTVAITPGAIDLMKPAAKKRPPVLDTQKFNIDVASLVKPKEEPKKENKKFKKIEDEISKKPEDTLTGLGIPPEKVNESFSTQKIEIIPEAEVKEFEKKLDKAREEKHFATQKIELPIERATEEKDVGDYEIIGLIARGGMAEIYKAKKKGVKGFEKIIALKKILSGYGEDDKYIEMFVDEAKIAAELSHPNIVQIYDLGKKDDFYFIAMEHVLGKDLRLILRKLAGLKRPFPEELALHLILKVLSALNYAHSAKDSSGRALEIVHRDVSPPNILVSFSGDVKLTDFGVSKATNKMHETVSGALKGKLLYMSPEQAKGDSAVDYRSDLYSVGIILFELITGKKLFIDSSDLLVLKKVQEGEVIMPREIKKDINPELENIILKSLNKNRDRRYNNAADMMRDIESYLIKNYERQPAAVHLSHFLHDTFKEEIDKEDIKPDLKPLPYKVKRIGEPEAVREEEREIVGLDDLHIPVEDEDRFEPIIEIDLDKEKDEDEDEPPPKQVKPAAAERPVFSELEESGKKKNVLLWVILAAAAAVVLFLIISFI
ncbi:MAG: protein kinase [Candidatus Aminicenantes bacterium]|nr:protein kinase [Candidatus Aminicenantes bacterium]